LHLLMALSIKNLHHPLPGTQTKTSVTFGCAYLTSSLLPSTGVLHQLVDHLNLNKNKEDLLHIPSSSLI
jgi:hypothetical protein